uniref:Putative abortive infection bacteriophage resistance related protein n=1 Tax=Magnetococcus massalia (strain MO-1) TaxID=451514 RepID=A0A1S7LIT6_MAGMO|nr:putative abortive infection bacteriophage resistance related protein [Candidatus Magnetococcus massalia]
MSELVKYDKPYKNSVELCGKLINQGLTIQDPDKAANLIERASYYRFKAYLFPFLNASKQFNDQANFDDAYSLYAFDEELRLMLFRHIQRIEIGVRSLFDQTMTASTENPFWYLDASLFDLKDGNHATTVNAIRDMFRKSKEPFAEHYRQKYYNAFCPFYRDLPPGWVAIELMTFGDLYSLLKSVTEQTKHQHKLHAFSQKILNAQRDGRFRGNYQTFLNWMKIIRDVRNCCCHHTRLFNRNLGSPSAIKKVLSQDISLVQTSGSSGRRQEDQVNRLYTALAAMQQILTGLGYDKIGLKLDDLFTQHPIVVRFHPSMGFPAQWKDEPLFF